MSCIKNAISSLIMLELFFLTFFFCGHNLHHMFSLSFGIFYFVFFSFRESLELSFQCFKKLVWIEKVLDTSEAEAKERRKTTGGFEHLDCSILVITYHLEDCNDYSNEYMFYSPLKIILFSYFWISYFCTVIKSFIRRYCFIHFAVNINFSRASVLSFSCFVRFSLKY